MKTPIIFCTDASLYFAKKIAENLKISVDPIIAKKFGNGEIYYRIGIEDRTDLFGKDVIFVSSTHTDEEIEAVYRIGCALAQMGTRKRIFVIPYLGYSTMERGVLPGEVVTAKTVMRKFSSIPNTGIGNTFLFMDLHVSGLIHYMEGDCLRFELYGEGVLEKGIREHIPLDQLITFGSADLGRPKWVQTFADNFGTDIVLVNKKRVGEQTTVRNVIGDVDGKIVIIYDDMLRSGGTFFHAADAYMAKGAKEVYGVISHLALNDKNIFDTITKSCIKKVITTNTHPMSLWALGYPNIQIYDVSHIFSEQIKKLLD